MVILGFQGLSTQRSYSISKYQVKISRNKHFIKFKSHTILRSTKRYHTAPLHPAQIMNHPFPSAPAFYTPLPWNHITTLLAIRPYSATSDPWRHRYGLMLAPHSECRLRVNRAELWVVPVWFTSHHLTAWALSPPHHHKTKNEHKEMLWAKEKEETHRESERENSHLTFIVVYYCSIL